MVVADAKQLLLIMSLQVCLPDNSFAEGQHFKSFEQSRTNLCAMQPEVNLTCLQMSHCRHLWISRAWRRSAAKIMSVFFPSDHFVRKLARTAKVNFLACCTRFTNVLVVCFSLANFFCGNLECLFLHAFLPNLRVSRSSPCRVLLRTKSCWVKR